MSKDKNEPMDASIHEDAVPSPVVRNPRPCWAAKTLVAEVEALFPETPFEYSDYTWRNAALSVTFDMTTLDSDEQADLTALLSLFDLDADARIAGIIVEEGLANVNFHANVRTQDDRSPFGLGDALDILSDMADEGGTLDFSMTFPEGAATINTDFSDIGGSL